MTTMSELDLKIEACLSKHATPKIERMGEFNAIEVIGGLVVGGLTALGLPKLWQYWFGHLTAKHEHEVQQDEELKKLKEKMTRIVTSVELLLIVIEHEFEENESIKDAIQKVKQHLVDDELSG